MIKLGMKARDTISGFEGIVIARTEWLYGCIRFTLSPQKLHEGKMIQSETFDEGQLVEIVPEVAATPVESKRTGGDRPSPTRSSDPAR
jgi:hypothetical protein